MKLIDANLVIYATNTTAPRHQAAKEWFDTTLSASETVALPWAVTLAFVRITTNPRIMAPPLSTGAALAYLREWYRRPNVIAPAPTARHIEVMSDLLEATGVGGNLVPDAHIAALAIEHGATLCSCDTDFARFPSLDYLDPLA